MSVPVSIQAPVQQFGLNDFLLKKAVDGLTADDLLRAPGDESTPALWLLGHITDSRSGLAVMLGVERERYRHDLFGRGTRMRPETCPPVEEILAAYDEATAQLAERFEAVTADELAAPAPRDLPTPDKSLGGAVAFLAFHETYHVGQLAYLRKWLGRGALVG